MRLFSGQACLLTFAFLFLSLNSCDNSNDSKLKKSGEDDFIELSKEQRIEDRFAQEREMTMDPTLGYVPRKALIRARAETKRQIDELKSRAAIPNVAWEERGPNNVGGRTRALMFDPNDPTARKVWAGGVGGGLWYSNDITFSYADWQHVDDFWSNMAIASMAYDPGNTQVFYVGTGEGYGNADSQDGDGIWASTDGGLTWTQMANTTSFNDCNQIICFKPDHILVATNNGLRLSTNAGVSWTTVRSGNHADAEVAANGDLYAGNFAGDIFKSTDDGATWTTVRNGSGNRVEIATAPSDPNYVYAIVNTSSQVNEVFKSTDAGATWQTKPAPFYLNQNCTTSTSSFARGQAWYDMIMLIAPHDKEKIIVGGVDLHRSEDGGDTWGAISYWTGNCDAYLHADQHALVSRPGFPQELISGNDGGVAYSNNAFTTGSNPTFEIQNENYNITQFYATAVHPEAGTTNFLVGAQDNGTKRLSSEGIGIGSNVTGGDGAFCHIDQLNPDTQITSYVYNNYYISTNGVNFSSYSLGNTGRFINPTDYDNDTKKIYSCRGNDEYLIVENVGGTLSNQVKSIPEFGGRISCVKVSPNVANVVYFGISGQRICRIDDADGTPVFTDLGNPSNSSSYISSIDVEIGNENHLLATFSNYGVASVHESTDGGVTWNDIEGDLPNMPIRWGIFNPSDANQVILGTELGVWTCDDITATAVDWEPSNSGLSNTRVSMLEYRTSDKLVVAATHGRGAFTSVSFNPDCNIGAYTLGAQVCDAGASTYSQEVTLVLNNTPATGDIDINGQTFSFTTNMGTVTETFTLNNLVANGDLVGLDISFSAAGTCTKTVSNAFLAPSSDCSFTNIACQGAIIIPNNGTYTTDGPSSGNGCNNCSSAEHADWYKFTPPTTGVFDIASCGGGEDTRVWIYIGDCNDLIALGGNDDACEMSTGSQLFASQVLNFQANPSYTYYFEWDNRWTDDGFDFTFEFKPCPNGQSMIFVDAAATGNNSGCDWTNAMTNLQEALDSAAAIETVNQVWVKTGTYMPGTSTQPALRSTSFTVSEAVSILGGFAGTEASPLQRDLVMNPTILSGDIGILGDFSDNTYQVITHTGAYELTLDGLIIENGNANGVPQSSGAGINNSGLLNINNCILRNHTSNDDGSALVNLGSTAILNANNLTLTNNSGQEVLSGNGADFNVLSNSVLIIE